MLGKRFRGTDSLKQDVLLGIVSGAVQEIFKVKKKIKETSILNQ